MGSCCAAVSRRNGSSKSLPGRDTQDRDVSPIDSVDMIVRWLIAGKISTGKVAAELSYTGAFHHYHSAKSAMLCCNR